MTSVGYWGHEAFLSTIYSPFAARQSRRTKIAPYADPMGLSYPIGVPPSMTVPRHMGGAPFSRQTINGLAYQASLCGFLNQIGFDTTFSTEVCEKIGGYPKGAILRYLEDALNDPILDKAEAQYEKGEISFAKLKEVRLSRAATLGKARIVRDVISLEPNNDKNFVYDKDTNPEPYKIGSIVDGKVWWKFVQTPAEECPRLIPDLSKIEESPVLTKLFQKTDEDEEVVYTHKDRDPAGWLYVKFECQNFADLLEKISRNWSNPSVINSYINQVNYCGGVDEIQSPKYGGMRRIYINKRCSVFTTLLPSHPGYKHIFVGKTRCLDYKINLSVYRVGLLEEKVF